MLHFSAGATLGERNGVRIPLHYGQPAADQLLKLLFAAVDGRGEQVAAEVSPGHQARCMRAVDLQLPGVVA